MLLDAEAVIEMIDELAPTDFYRPGHGRVFEAMRIPYGRSQPIGGVGLRRQSATMALERREA